MELIKHIYTDLKFIFSWLVNLSPKIKKQRYLIYGFFGMVMLVCFLIDHSNKENGMTDWISAFANVVMAGAAVCAIVVARHWRHGLTDKEALAAGVKLKGEILDELKSASFRMISPNSVRVNLQHANYLRTAIGIKDFYNGLYEFNKEFEVISEVLVSVKKSLGDLNLYGWSIHQRKRELFFKLFEIEDSIALTKNSINDYINEVIPNYDIHFNYYVDYPMDLYSENKSSEEKTVEVMREVMENYQFSSTLRNYLDLIVTERSRMNNVIKEIQNPIEDIFLLIEQRK